jgi:hypothetical protein
VLLVTCIWHIDFEYQLIGDIIIKLQFAVDDDCTIAFPNAGALCKTFDILKGPQEVQLLKGVKLMNSSKLLKRNIDGIYRRIMPEHVHDHFYLFKFILLPWALIYRFKILQKDIYIG